MKATPDARYLAAANGTARTMQWKWYARKVSDISIDLLSAPAWVEITSYLSAWTEIQSKLEYNVGQPSADMVTLTGHKISFWESNLLNLAAGEYLEVKCLFYLTASSGYAHDSIQMFAGFADVERCRKSRLTDTLTINCFTADELGNRMEAERISTQYIKKDVDGSGTDGLILHGIPGVYVTDAAVTSYVLTLGTHTIGWQYDSIGGAVMFLDDGDRTGVSTGTNTLQNGDGTQKVEVYIPDVAATYHLTDEHTDTLLVVSEGVTLCNQWYHNVALKHLLKKLYTEIGITTVTYDDLEIPTALGGSKISYLGTPPDNEAVNGRRWAIASDGTNLYMGIGNKVYKRDAAGLYSQAADLVTDRAVWKLLYNARNNHLWVIAYDVAPGSYDVYVYRLALSGSTLSSGIVIGDNDGDVHWNSMELIDYTWDGGSTYKYGMVFTFADTAGLTTSAVKFVDGTVTPMTLNTVFDAATLGRAVKAKHLFVTAGRQIYFHTDNSGTLELYYINISSSTGAWTNVGVHHSGIEDWNVGAYDSANGRIYYWHVSSQTFRSITMVSSTPTTHYTASVTLLAQPEIVFYGANIGGAVIGIHTDENKRELWRAVDGAAATRICDDGGYATYTAMCSHDGATYGIDYAGRLFKYDTAVGMYIPLADFSGKTVWDALKQVTTEFGLLHTLRASKSAAVYRRGGDSGAPPNSGSTMTVTLSIAGDLEDEAGVYAAVGWVQVENDRVRYSYDGTNWNRAISSSVRTLTLKSDLIPDEIVQDLTKHLYLYFSTGFSLKHIPITAPLFQYEPFDAANISLTGGSLQASGTGVIYAITYRRNGTMTLEVLL